MFAPTSKEAENSADDHADTPSPVSAHTVSARSLRAWKAWLGALATDAEAALAASMAYRELEPGDREAWLQSLEDDSRTLQVPRIAVYAPLLAVEVDPARRARIREAIGPEQADAAPREPVRALWGEHSDLSRVAVIVRPLYMNFVEVLACSYAPSSTVNWVRHDPIVLAESTVRPGDEVGGVLLDERPVKGVVDELAETIVAHNRSGSEVPEALRAFAHLFDPDFDC